MRWFVLLFLMINSLLAEGIPDKALGPIYTEALWFVAVIAVMAVISFVISSRNAKRYEEKLALEKREESLGKSEEESGKGQEERVKGEEELGKSEENLETLDDGRASSVDRLLELSKLHKEGLLSKEEFITFKMQLYRELKDIHVNS